MRAYDRKARRACQERNAPLADLFGEFAAQLQCALEDTGTLHESETIAALAHPIYGRDGIPAPGCEDCATWRQCERDPWSLCDTAKGGSR